MAIYPRRARCLKWFLNFFKHLEVGVPVIANQDHFLLLVAIPCLIREIRRASNYAIFFGFRIRKKVNLLMGRNSVLEIQPALPFLYPVGNLSSLFVLKELQRFRLNNQRSQGGELDLFFQDGLTPKYKFNIFEFSHLLGHHRNTI